MRPTACSGVYGTLYPYRRSDCQERFVVEVPYTACGKLRHEIRLAYARLYVLGGLIRHIDLAICLISDTQPQICRCSSVAAKST